MTNKTKTKIRIIWRIITGRYNHSIIVNISKKDLLELLQEKPFNISAEFYGISNYLVYPILERVVKSEDKIDSILDKAKIDAIVEESLKNKN